MAVSLEELAAKGPLKPEALRGLQDLDDYVKHEDLTVINGLKDMPPRVGTREVTDETYHRTGWILEEEITKQMLEASTKAKDSINVNLVERKQCLVMDELNEQVDLIRGLVMMFYPAYHGLGEWEPIRCLLEEKEDFYEANNSDDMNPGTATMWWAGKELQDGKLLSDYIGKNEKTKIVMKIQKKGQGPPVREPMIDKEVHTKMLSFYHKKQEEQKELEDNNEDDYMNSAWANPKALKGTLHGQGDIKFR